VQEAARSVSAPNLKTNQYSSMLYPILGAVFGTSADGVEPNSRLSGDGVGGWDDVEGAPGVYALPSDSADPSTSSGWITVKENSILPPTSRTKR
jgi:hypothetical protein